MLSHFVLDPSIRFLNHGSFGACPRPVLQAQQRLRERLEFEPVSFFVRDLERLLDAARIQAAQFVGCDPDDFAFVTNATSGVNTVLRSLSFSPGDELLTTNHTYNACKNALDAAAARSGARVVVAPVPFPLSQSQQVVDAVMECVTHKTRLALLDHVTSPTGLVLPIAELVSAMALRGIDVLVDGAHAPGMLPLDVASIGAAYYTGNFHKWCCAPKGAGFLHVRRDRQAQIRPLTISHGANSPRRDRSRFRVEFDWTGTSDPTAYLCVPESLHFLGSLYSGGWPALMKANRDKALAARALLGSALSVPLPCPPEMIGTLVALPLSDGDGAPSFSPLDIDPLQEALRHRFHIEVPILAWPAPPRRWVRISAQVYNTEDDYAQLAAALQTLLRTD